MEGGLTGIQRIDRARRNALKAASLVLGAVVATGALHKLASAAPGGNGNGNGNGGSNGNGNGNGNGNNGRGRNRTPGTPRGPRVMHPNGGPEAPQERAE